MQPITISDSEVQQAREAIRRLDARWTSAINERNGEVVEDLFTVDGRIFVPGSPPITGRVGIRRFVRAFVVGSGRQFIARPESVDIAASGEMAYLTGQFWLETAEGTVRGSEGKYLAIWKIVAERWHLAITTMSRNGAISHK